LVMPEVLVTGGSGYVGSWCVLALLHVASLT
jgi:nucleoside-diphosphate-sugar epimerase